SAADFEPSFSRIRSRKVSTASSQYCKQRSCTAELPRGRPSGLPDWPGFQPPMPFRVACLFPLQLLALLGHHAMSDLRPECATERTSDDRSEFMAHALVT